VVGLVGVGLGGEEGRRGAGGGRTAGEHKYVVNAMKAVWGRPRRNVLRGNNKVTIIVTMSWVNCAVLTAEKLGGRKRRWWRAGEGGGGDARGSR
jgi:hypothetical protein